MVQLNLLDDEASVLREMLESDLSDLRMEIANTDSLEFRLGLKKREGLLRKLIEQLDSQKIA